LQATLFEQGETQTQTSLDVVRVFVEQLAKDLFSLLEVASAQGAIAFVVSLLVSETGGSVTRAGKRKTKYEGGHTEGRHPRETLLVISLHDSHLLSDRQPSRMQLLLQNFSCLHGPENQVKLVKINADVASKTNQLLLDFEILPSG
jgi:hypothetical protein